MRAIERTDRHDEANSRFLQFRECASKRVHRDIVVRIVTGYGLDELDSNPGNGKRLVCSPRRTEGPWGPRSLLFNDHPEVERPERGPNHKPPSSVKVKNE
jgi:hypothetical protein